GDVNEWLTIGPFRAKDAATALDETFLDEASVAPAESDKVGELAWEPLILPSYPDHIREPDNLKKNVHGIYRAGFATRSIMLGDTSANQVVYAHTYLHADRAGPAVFIVNHMEGMRAWINGKQVYSETKMFQDHINANGMHVHNRTIAAFLTPNPAPRFTADLNKGWNRVLFKVTRKNGHEDLQRNGHCAFMLRITVPEDTRYESKNVKWATQMPNWAITAPIVVGDKIFVTSEPDELVCIDKNSGKILWRCAHPIPEVISAEERAKNPEIFLQIDPLSAEIINGTRDGTLTQARGIELRRQIYTLLNRTNPGMYFTKPFNVHFSTVGYAARMPVSDGRFVYAHFGPHVAVAYDMDGNRQWIQNTSTLGLARRVEITDKTPNMGFTYPHQPVNTPVIVGNNLIIHNGWLRAFNKNTGEMVWDTGILDKGFDGSHEGIPKTVCAQSLIPLRFGGIDAVMGFHGRIFRASDGHMMSGPTSSVMTWTTPVVDDDFVYVWSQARQRMSVEDGEIKQTADVRTSQGNHAMSSPLVHNGLIYYLRAHGQLSVFEADTNQLVYNQNLPMNPLLHSSSMGATASVSIAGNYIYLFDDQGTGIIIEPGRTFRQVVVNRIDTMMNHPWPLSTMERTWSTPTFDGKHMFIRSEKMLYCIGS
ncbi:MAG: PQQ-binding-like beta-propeller repeat protein, partial [Phycisphaerales bacterium]|nr:PQQ-binding-like beta-propeller repeat protein [Phycisphaerales bacterium]